MKVTSVKKKVLKGENEIDYDSMIANPILCIPKSDSRVKSTTICFLLLSIIIGTSVPSWSE